MKIGTMFGDIVRSLFRHTATRRYPSERKPAPEHLRGKLYWDAEKCTGCSLCSKDCPANAIEIIMVDKAAKRFIACYRLDRCAFCAQCVLSCPQNALRLSNDEWELADTSQAAFTIFYGAKPDVERFLAEPTEADADSAANEE